MTRNWLTAVDPEIVWQPESSSDIARLAAEAKASIGNVIRGWTGIPFRPVPGPERLRVTTPAICIDCFAMGS